MKKFLVMLLALAGVFVFTGCDDSPQDVVAIWATAIVDGDLDTANEYSTERTHVLNALMVGMMSGKEESDEVKNFKENVEKIADAKVEINGDVAKVYINEDDDNPVVLKKVDGEWKVDVQK